MSDTTAKAPPPDYKYWAFVCYSHQDNLATRGDGGGDHIRWANWLHEQLETYRIPDGYRDRSTRTGEPMPARFFPTFRDEAELPTSHDLGGQIRDALDRSRFLIVIASPRSARSRYVNEEVRYFRQFGRGDRILTLIVDGEPNARLTPKAGWTADGECFCPALVHPLRPDGSVDDTALLCEEPIAADVRVKDVEPPREMRASERDQSDRRALLDFMKLKIIAGLMGVGLDELVQRDKIRQLDAARQRARTLRRWLGAVGLLTLLAIIGGVVAWQQRKVALQNESKDRVNEQRAVAGLKEASRSDVATAQQRLADGKWQEAVAHLGRAIRYDPDNEDAQESLYLSLRYGRRDAGRLPINLLAHTATVASAKFSPDGSRIVTASHDNTARIWDAKTGVPIGSVLRHDWLVTDASFSPDSSRVVTASWDDTARVWDAKTGQPTSPAITHRSTPKPPGYLAKLPDAGGVNCAYFSPDGSLVVTAYKNTAQVWDARTSQPVGQKLIHKGEVTSADFSPDGYFVVTTNLYKITTPGSVGLPPMPAESVGDTAHVWDVKTGLPIALTSDQGERVSYASFSPTGSLIATLSGVSSTVRIWDAKTRQSTGIVFKPNGSFERVLPEIEWVFERVGERMRG